MEYRKYLNITAIFISIMICLTGLATNTIAQDTSQLSGLRIQISPGEENRLSRFVAAIPEEWIVESNARYSLRLRFEENEVETCTYNRGELVRIQTNLMAVLTEGRNVIIQKEFPGGLPRECRFMETIPIPTPDPKDEFGLLQFQTPVLIVNGSSPRLTDFESWLIEEVATLEGLPQTLSTTPDPPPIETITPNNNDQETQDVLQSGTIVASSSLRTLSTTQSNAITTLSVGTIVNILAEEQGQSVTLRGITNSTWYYIRDESNREGYVWSGLIELDESVASNTAVPTETPTGPESTSTPMPNDAVVDNRDRYGVVIKSQGTDISYRIGSSNRDPVNAVIERIPDVWRVLPDQEPRFEILIQTSIDEIEQCSYQGNGQTITLIRRQMLLHISITDLQTETIIDDRMFSSEAPRNCRQTESFASSTTVATLTGEFNADGFELWLFTELASRIEIPGMRFMLFDIDTAEVNPLRAIQYSPDGRAILSRIGQDLVIYDANNGDQLSRFTQHNDLVLSGDFSPDGAFVVSLSSDGDVWMWDAATGASVRRLEAVLDEDFGGPYQRTDVSFSQDGRIVNVMDPVGGFRSWDTETGELLHQEVLDYDTFAFSPNGTIITIVDKDMLPRIFDTATGELLYELRSNMQDAFGVVYSDDGQFMVLIPSSTVRNTSIEIWNVTTGMRHLQIANYDYASTNYLNAHFYADFSHDNKSLVTSGRVNLGGTGIHMWDVSIGEELALPEALSRLRSDAVILSPDETALFTLEDGAARLRSIETGEVLLNLGGGARSYIAFSPDGQSILISSENILTVWDTNYRYNASQSESPTILSSEESDVFTLEQAVEDFSSVTIKLSDETGLLTSYSPSGNIFITNSERLLYPEGSDAEYQIPVPEDMEFHLTVYSLPLSAVQNYQYIPEDEESVKEFAEHFRDMVVARSNNDGDITSNVEVINIGTHEVAVFSKRTTDREFTAIFLALNPPVEFLLLTVTHAPGAFEKFEADIFALIETIEYHN